MSNPGDHDSTDPEDAQSRRRVGERLAQALYAAHVRIAALTLERDDAQAHLDEVRAERDQVRLERNRLIEELSRLRRLEHGCP